MSISTLGPGNGDVAYRMQSLRHGPAEPVLDRGVPAGTLLRLWLWAAVPALIVGAVFGFLALVLFAVSGPGLSDGTTPGDGMLSAGSMLGFIVFWTVLLAVRIDEPVGEWTTLLEERWQGADSAYAAIYATLRRRGIPVEVDAVRLRSDLLPPEVVDNRLLIADRDYRIAVSIFPYGSGLSVGWTMWRGRRGATVLGNFLRDVGAGMVGQGVRAEDLLRGERVRALREAVHAAVREGAEVAAQGLVVPIGPAFGAEVPILDLRTSVPAFPAFAAPPAPPATAPPATAPPATAPAPAAVPPAPAVVESDEPGPPVS
ncbi:Major cell-surface adhesin PAc [Actinoplanes sp. SE50]|uniref:hypothetical protein n=1 Tax=unclassified Actinoplanes TaxID=2626549 RepID=UPI00023ECD85|nr:MULTISPECIES: hypothetical protein [unclassified Actinoplanes]AEV87206.1 Major cell-surface adhesin PAc [Actinoplanes sp. SE50/110]ATO85607.1 Major cell-surface adhesin PAc [Actinoplanes sp. SE50]SLM03020.1 Major cell-surface adhesin PAc [Actinoplanes sp. SE50/110]